MCPFHFGMLVEMLAFFYPRFKPPRPSPPLHPPLLPSSPSVRFCSALFYPYAFHPRTNCTSEVVDLSRTSVAGNLPDCEETSSYVGIYRAFIFQRILIRKCTSFVFRERYEYSPLSPHDLSFEVSNRSNCLNTSSSPLPHPLFV